MVGSGTVPDDAHEAVGLLDGADSAEKREAMYIELYHLHLPKLAALGIIDWDPDSGELSTGPEWEQAEPLLRLIETHRDELPASLSAPTADN